MNVGTLRTFTSIVQMNVYTDRSNERSHRSLLRTLNLVMAAHGLSQKDLEKAQQAIDTLSSIVSDRPGPSRLSSDHGTVDLLHLNQVSKSTFPLSV